MKPFVKGKVMKQIDVFLFSGIIALLVGCASAPLVLQPVGPCSASHEASDTNGHLQVFSVMEAQSEGDDPVWYQHSSYSIYAPQGKRVKYVGNTIGKFDETPQTVTLPAGTYTVKARAEGYRYLVIKVQVEIERGKTTAVHLEGGWNPPAGSEIVRASCGYAVGWLAGSPISSSGR
jgi:hypothetical protein